MTNIGRFKWKDAPLPMRKSQTRDDTLWGTFSPKPETTTDELSSISSAASTSDESAARRAAAIAAHWKK